MEKNLDEEFTNTNKETDLIRLSSYYRFSIIRKN